MTRRSPLIVLSLLGSLMLAIVGGAALLPAPAAAGGPALQDRPTVEPPRPTVASPDDYEEGDEGEDSVVPGTFDLVGIKDTPAPPAGPDEAAEAEAGDDQTPAEQPLPAHLPTTGSGAPAGTALLILLAGIALIAGVTLRDIHP